MESRIIIDRMCVHACHGVMEQERIVGTDFYVSIDALVSVSASAYRDDSLRGTVSYADVSQVIIHQMQMTSQLLEHVVWRIGNVLLDTFPQMLGVRVRIDKNNPPMGIQAESVGVEMAFGSYRL